MRIHLYVLSLSKTLIYMLEDFAFHVHLKTPPLFIFILLQQAFISVHLIP